jgi:2-dehydro-3-deoxygalactonokinase
VIAVDWGTSNFRAFRLQQGGIIAARRSSPRGILYVRKAQFEAVLCEEVGDWLDDGEKQILLCGMVGSREGWIESDYVPCPVGLSDLVAATVKIPFIRAQVQLVPGILAPGDNGVPEMIRGEETETMGILDTCGGNGLVCFPGSHSKWISLKDNKIVNFSTFLTGELFAALRKCTILGRIMPTEESNDIDGFDRGVIRSADPGSMLHHLFGVRSLVLAGLLKEKSSASYLSGLIIGHEVRSAIRAQVTVHLVGSAQLCSLYARAIRLCGGSASICCGDAAARGLAAIGARLSWN